MSLIAIASDPMEGEDQNFIWSFNHEQHHLQIASKLTALHGIPDYDGRLDPIPKEDMQDWLYQHQAIHNIMNQSAGKVGQDLTTVNWKDTLARQAWLWQNLREHQAISDSLGV